MIMIQSLSVISATYSIPPFSVLIKLLHLNPFWCDFYFQWIQERPAWINKTAVAFVAKSFSIIVMLEGRSPLQIRMKPKPQTQVFALEIWRFQPSVLGMLLDSVWQKIKLVNGAHCQTWLNHLNSTSRNWEGQICLENNAGQDPARVIQF